MTSWDILTLDTALSTLSIEAPVWIRIPETGEVVVTAIEDIHSIEIIFIDAGGTVHTLGAVISGSTATADFNTPGLASGEGTLTVTITDLVGNTTTDSVDIDIAPALSGSYAFWVLTDVNHVLEVDAFPEDVYSALTNVEATLEVVSRTEGSYLLISDVEVPDG